MLIEVANSEISWIEPRDLTINELVGMTEGHRGPLTSTNHESGRNVLFAGDGRISAPGGMPTLLGRVMFLREDTPVDVLRSFATTNGSETDDPRDFGY
jgi:hypothetical protein